MEVVSFLPRSQSSQWFSSLDWYVLLLHMVLRNPMTQPHVPLHLSHPLEHRKVQDFRSEYGLSLTCCLGGSRAQWAWIWASILTVFGLDPQLCYLPSVCPWTSCINLVSFIWNMPCWEQQGNNRLVPLSIQYPVKGRHFICLGKFCVLS